MIGQGNPKQESFLIILIALGTFVGWPSLVVAVKPSPTPPVRHLHITEVFVDLEADTLTIQGEHLDFGGTLKVTLGELGALLIIGVPTETEIIAGLPQNIPAGDYLLTVSRGNGQSQQDEYGLTISGSTAGAGGCPADQVVQGINANGTFNCVPDMHVKGTFCPAGQVATGYDANGNIQCAVDQDTDTRAVGSCPAGQVISAINLNGTVTCVADMQVKGTSCPAGQFLTGYDAQGQPQCAAFPVGDPNNPCASGGVEVGTRWIVSFSGRVVCDKDTNRNWEQHPTALIRNWEDSKTYCAGLGAGWELPELNVLQTLVDTNALLCGGGSEDPCLPPGHPFDNILDQPGSNASYWSVTTDAGNPSNALTVGFLLGNVDTFNKASTGRLAWCVH